MTAPIASGWSESPGGPCTHWKAPPCHGARRNRPFREVSTKLANSSRKQPGGARAGIRGTADSTEPCLRRERLTGAAGVSIERAILRGDGGGRVVILVDTASGTG